MKFEKFTLYFSESRISRYLDATNGSETKAKHTYKGNLRVCQAIYPLLGIVEVVIRNRLNDVLATYFNDFEWILNQRSVFMSDPSLIFRHKITGRHKVNDFLKKEVDSAEMRVLKTKSGITSSKVIAELTFGFWTDLFEVYHYKLLRGRPIQIFKTLPAGHGRKEVKEMLDTIRRFRNRISHNEPICFYNNQLDYKMAIDAYQAIISILTWIDLDLLTFINDLDSVQETIESEMIGV